MRILTIVTCLLLLIPFIAGGCVGKGTVEPTKMYVLNSMEPRQKLESSVIKEDTVIGITRMGLATYLKRPHIITRVEGNEIHLADFARWAEPLEDGISKILAENLSILLGTDKVLIAPWRRDLEIDYQVHLNIVRFDARIGGDVVLAVRWGVVEGDAESPMLIAKIYTYREPLSGSSYGAIVAAENSLLEDLSRDVAAEIARMTAR